MKAAPLTGSAAVAAAIVTIVILLLGLEVSLEDKAVVIAGMGTALAWAVDKGAKAPEGEAE